MGKKVKQKHYFLLRISKKQTVRIGVPCSDAKSPVILKRSLADVLAGEEGLAVTCANACCALREDGEAFPHDVFMASFTDNRAYIVDKLDKRGVPSHCVRYAHNDGAFQKAYDTKGKQRLSKMSGVEATIVLNVPPKRRASGTGVSHGGTSGPNGKAIKRELHGGDIARALRAGFNFVPPGKHASA